MPSRLITRATSLTRGKTNDRTDTGQSRTFPPLSAPQMDGPTGQTWTSPFKGCPAVRPKRDHRMNKADKTGMMIIKARTRTASQPLASWTPCFVAKRSEGGCRFGFCMRGSSFLTLRDLDDSGISLALRCYLGGQLWLFECTAKLCRSSRCYRGGSSAVHAAGGTRSRDSSAPNMKMEIGIPVFPELPVVTERN